MKKKSYFKPEIEAYKVESTELLAESGSGTEKLFTGSTEGDDF